MEFKRISASASKYVDGSISYYSEARGIPKSRLIIFAILNELKKDKPFDIDLKIPDYDEYVEYEYADQAGKILSFLRTQEFPTGIDVLLSVRHDLGIEKEEDILRGFRELIEKDLITRHKPDKKYYRHAKDDYFVFCAKGDDPASKKKIRQEKYERKKLEELKKKYEGELKRER